MESLFVFSILSGVSEASTAQTSNMVKRKSTMARLDDNTSEEVKSMMQSMAANDWQKRQNGIEQFHDLTIKNPDAVIMQMVKV